MADFSCVELKKYNETKFSDVRLVDWHTQKGVYRALVKQKRSVDDLGKVTYGKIQGWNWEDIKFLSANMETIINDWKTIPEVIKEEKAEIADNFSF